ncbi:hypothetical protein GGR51DRAFT_568935 [Nemania sp. FL0031]|nr:hypothetical protein GGR51DRAFT_568935 [Nemania sp. FL0031]
MSIVQLLQVPTAGAVNPGCTTVNGVAEKFRNASGNKAVFWAPQHEDNKIVGLAAVWSSQEDQKAWAASLEGQEVKSAIQRLSDGALYDDIVVFPEEPLPALGAKVVELISWIYSVKQFNAKKNDIEKGFKDFQSSVIEQAPEADGGSVSGWGQEFNHGGEPSRRFTLLIGWGSVDAHDACKKSKQFKDNLHHLTDHESMYMEDIVHYAYSQSLED